MQPMRNMAPSLDAYQRVSSSLNGKMQVTNTDRILQAADAKLTERVENQTRDKRVTTESTEIGIKLINDTASTTRNNMSDSSKGNTSVAIFPRNVILLLIDERNQDEKREKDPWEDHGNGLSFAIKGSLQVLS